VLLVFDSRLSRYLYSTVLTADPLPSVTGFPALALNGAGIWLGGHPSGRDWPPGPASNWSDGAPTPDANVSLVGFRF
jgi:hypothetical protein